MMKKSFLVFSDLHVKNDNLDECISVLNQIEECSSENDTDKIFFLGDLYEKKRYVDLNIFNRVYSELYKLSECCNRLYLMVGNHDRSLENSEHCMSSMFPFSEIISDFSIIYDKDNKIEFHCVPYLTGGLMKSGFKVEPTHRDYRQILFFHGSYSGLRINNHSLSSDFTKEEMNLHFYDLVMGGHIHKRMQFDKNALYVGSPLHKDFSDCGEDKGFYTVDYETLTPIFHKLEYPEFIKIVTKRDIKEYRDKLRNSHIWLFLDGDEIHNKLKKIAKSVRYTPIIEEREKEEYNDILNIELALVSYLKEKNEDVEKRLFQYKDRWGKFSSVHKDVKIGMLRAKNFLSYKDLEWDFSILTDSPIGIFGKNGAGKSSFVESIVWGIYGSTIRNASADSVVNRKFKNNCHVNIVFQSGSKNIEINRYRKHEKEKNNLNISEGKGSEKRLTQIYINNLLCPLSHFKTLITMGSGSVPIMRLKPSDRKSVIENVIGMNWIEEEYKSIKKELSKREQEYMKISMGLENVKDRYQDLQNELLKVDELCKQAEDEKREKREEIERRIDEIGIIASNMHSKLVEREKIVNSIEEKLLLNSKVISEITEKKDNSLRMIEKERIQLRNEIRQMESEIRKWKKKIKNDNSEVSVCDFCLSKYNPKDVNRKIEKIISEKEDELKRVKNIIKKKDEEADKIRVKYSERHEMYVKEREILEKELSNVGITELKMKIERLLGERDQLERELNSIESENKWKKYYNELRDKISSLEEEMRMSEKEERNCKRKLDYCKFWKEAFSLSGFRKNLIRIVLPFLERKINNYLSQWNLKCKITMKGKREDINISLIEENKNVEYSLYSGGERNRIDCAILFSLYEIASMLTMKINVLILDEVLTGLDEEGASDVYKMTKDFMNRIKIQVYMITHNVHMQSLFEKYIRVKNEKDFSQIYPVISS